MDMFFSLIVRYFGDSRFKPFKHKSSSIRQSRFNIDHQLTILGLNRLIWQQLSSLKYDLFQAAMIHFLKCEPDRMYLHLPFVQLLLRRHDFED